MVKELKKELKNLTQVEKIIIKTIKEAPEGSFRCSENRGYYQYYQGKKYLSKKKLHYISKIAQKDYCIKMKDAIEKIKDNIGSFISAYEEMEQIYCTLTPGRKVLVTPLIKPIEQIIQEFEAIQYEPKAFEENDTTEFFTSKGERVRSKSEKIIADELYRRDIPYKYEMPIELESWGKKVIFHADFIVLNKRTGKMIIIEHLGMMDDPSYYERAMKRIDTYEKNGYLLGDTLLIFHETLNNPLNTIVMQKYIEKYLL